MTPIRALALVPLVVGLAASATEAQPRHPAHAGAPLHVTPHLWRRHTVPSSLVRVHDGDTFYAGTETIRLRGIDTPELGQPQSRAATNRLAALLHEGPVTIIPRAEDVYGRTVADVYVRDRNVADVLRSEGFQKPGRH